MKDDVVDAHWTAEELSLLGSADLDRPPEDAIDKTLSALGVGVAAGVSAAVVMAGTTSAAASRSSGLLLKWLPSALLGAGAVGAVTIAMVASTSSAPSLARPSAASVTTATSALPPPQLEPSRPAASSTVAAIAPSATRSTRPAPSQAKASAEPTPAGKSLTEEIRAIDEARRLLRSGDAQGALGALARYDVMVGGRGSMRAEATVVRIEALRSSGDSAGAQALGLRFLTSNPRSPYADHVRRILARP